MEILGTSTLPTEHLFELFKAKETLESAKPKLMKALEHGLSTLILSFVKTLKANGVNDIKFNVSETSIEEIIEDIVHRDKTLFIYISVGGESPEVIVKTGNKEIQE